ncbi:MAG: response regulator [Albidovulum sp.]
MTDDLSDFISMREPTALRPLLGLTVLVVEDSRFACEAIRLMCLRSGARIRRADCLASARRHLAAYRPTVVVVDVGLPDGSGLDLMEEIAGRTPRVPVLLGTSGDAGAKEAALATGADGFLTKPLESLLAFQSAILSVLPATARPVLASGSADDHVIPDQMALHDDLAQVADMLGNAADGATLDYLAQFLSGIARSAHDAPLEAAVQALTRDRIAGRDTGMLVTRVNGLVRARLAAGSAF